MFLGRIQELAFLQERIDDALRGQSSCSLIRGERGSGKTRLIDELRRQNAGLCFEVLRCHHADAAKLIHDIVKTATNDGALVIVVEDVDRAGQKLLDAIATYHDREFVWIVTFAPALEPSDEFEESIAALKVLGAHEMRLPPLDDAAIERILSTYRIQGKHLSRGSLKRIIQLSGGNPAFAQEIARGFSSHDADEETLVPDAQRARAKTLLGKLDDDARVVLTVASLIGQEYSADFVADVLERPAAEITVALLQAARYGLARKISRNRFIFAHPLLREAVRLEATAAWAAQYHLRIAKALESSPGADAEDFEASATHYRRACELEAAAVWSDRAARAYLDREAYVDAARAFRHAAELPSSDPRRHEALINLAKALRRGGFDEDALRVYEDILASDAELPPETKGGLMLDVMLLSWGNGNMARVEALSHEILALDISEESNIKPAALSMLAGFASGAGRFHDAIAYLERLNDHPALEPMTLVQAKQQRAFATLGLKGFAAALPLFREGLVLAEHSVYMSSSFCSNFGTVALAHGLTRSGIEKLEQGFALAQESGSSSRGHTAASAYATGLVRLGRLLEARAVLERIGALSLDLNGIEVFFLGPTMLDVGSMLDESEFVERALELRIIEGALKCGEAQRVASVISSVSRHYWCIGETARAQSLLHDGMQYVHYIKWCYDFFILVAKYGLDADVPVARQRLAHAVHDEERIADAYMNLFDAFVGRRRGRSARAAELGKRAATTFAALRWPLLEAEAHEAAGSRAEALQIYEAIGNARDARILHGSMRPMQRGRGQVVGLTKRERAIAELAVQGLSNKEIAERLGIGVRTVEFHLQGVYGKFGVRSRWQIPLDFAASP